MLCVVTPAILTGITIMGWIDNSPMSLDGYEYPQEWEVVGWVMELLPLAVVILYPIYTTFTVIIFM
jgi:hypothetical protein